MNKSLQLHKKLNTFWFWWNIVEAVVILAGGAVAIFAGIRSIGAVDAAPNQVETVLAYSIASFIVLDGSLRIVMFFPRYAKGDEVTPLVIAGFEVSLGILLMILEIKHSMVIESIVNLISILLIVMGGLFLAFSILQIVRRYVSVVMPIGQIILGALLIGVGIAIIILHNTSSAQRPVVLIMTGTTMCFVALSQFIITLINNSHHKKDIAEAEAEETGNYQIAEQSSANRNKGKAITKNHGEVVETEEIDDDENRPAIEGPKAIPHKKKKK